MDDVTCVEREVAEFSSEDWPTTITPEGTAGREAPHGLIIQIDDIHAQTI